MKIILAPDKFKGCLTASQVCDAMAEGIRRVDPSIQIDSCPMADGGEGTVEVIVRARGGQFVTRRVTGPLPEMKVDATFGLIDDGATAIIEMSAASGLQLLKPEQYDPMRATTYGTGQLLLAAADMGVKKVILGVGGSATIDGGLGCVQACGGVPVLKDSPEHTPAPHAVAGEDVGKFLWHVWDDRFTRHRVEIVVACDVNNPLAGPDGAARTYGPQKGATPEQVELLDAALASLGRRVSQETAQVPGAGAAGGLGFGMMVFFGATMRPGVELVIEATRLRERLTGADLCITGEGKLDLQSLAGKTCIGVARLCKSMKVPCVAIAGSVAQDAANQIHAELTEYVTLTSDSINSDEARQRAAHLIAGNAERVVPRYLK